MPRAHRHILAGRTYHITHRCHDREYLLKFARDRQSYRGWMREGLTRQDVSLLSYCITSNHVHLLLRASEAAEMGAFMQYVAGGSAQAYNLRKGRSGGFWSDRYHATMVEDGEHLWRCMRYIDLNMVRAGVVSHPREWDWTGWGELMGERCRNRVIDMDAVLETVGATDAGQFRREHEAAIESALKQGEMKRDPSWSEAVAVGSAGFVERIEGELLGDYTRRRLDRTEGEGGAMVLREAAATYGA